jgi:hypothetical protein
MDYSELYRYEQYRLALLGMNVSKKYLGLLRFVLKNASKYTPLQLLMYVDDKSGVLKNELTWALEWAAYKKNQDNYLPYYVRAFGFYGMSKEDAEKRFHAYHEKLKGKLENPNAV